MRGITICPPPSDTNSPFLKPCTVDYQFNQQLKEMPYFEILLIRPLQRRAFLVLPLLIHGGLFGVALGPSVC